MLCGPEKTRLRISSFCLSSFCCSRNCCDPRFLFDRKTEGKKIAAHQSARNAVAHDLFERRAGLQDVRRVGIEIEILGIAQHEPLVSIEIGEAVLDRLDRGAIDVGADVVVAQGAEAGGQDRRSPRGEL